MQRVRVKICGITNEPDALAAIEAGADALGFVSYPKSPRHIDPVHAAPWVRHLPPFVAKVIVCVNPSPQDLAQWARSFPVDAWQFHGDETPEVIRAAPPATRIRALRISQPLSREQLLCWPVEAFLLDTPTSTYGGSGETCDWSLAAAIKAAAHRPIILAGGLNPANVADAIRAVRPYAVDCSSGVEESPGRKDYAKLRDFIAACR
ncbi:MAG TPA: phosphoribosylanthranilate isomerase [Verrucomicrobiae bacterium]|nr:phosphoribosylanthranilate isomerase [Verrucomicrobiae bacterium]